jgi:hypothetical protein
MQSLDVRLKALEAEALTAEPSSAERMHAYCQSLGLDVPPVGNLNATEWLETVSLEVLQAMLASAGR